MYADDARAAHFASEKRRAAERWQAKPDLQNCTDILREKADSELCRNALSSALAVAAADPNAPPERLLPLLADSALAVARLSERARYQSLAEMGQSNLTGGAGARPVPPSMPSAATSAGAASAKSFARMAPRGQPALKLAESPAGKFLPVVLRLERDTLRNLGAYLEYAPLPVRRMAFDTVKRLRDTHPQWPLLDHLIREAALLESDAELKGALHGLLESGLSGDRSSQSTVSK